MTGDLTNWETGFQYVDLSICRNLLFPIGLRTLDYRLWASFMIQVRGNPFSDACFLCRPERLSLSAMAVFHIDAGTSSHVFSRRSPFQPKMVVASSIGSPHKPQLMWPGPNTAGLTLPPIRAFTASTL